MMNPVGWFEIYIQDMNRAVKFYETMLQVKLSPLFEPGDDGVQMLAFDANMDTYGASGALVYMKDAPSGGNSTLVYFSCEDCAVEEARVIDAGGQVERGKMSIGEHGFISLIKDSEDNLIGLHSMK